MTSRLYLVNEYGERVPVPSTHTRTPHQDGPDYCAECSEAQLAWQTWPCEWTVTPPPAPEVRPYQSVEVTIPEAVLDDLEAFLWERDWTLRQRPMNDREWYAVPVLRGDEKGSSKGETPRTITTGRDDSQ